MSLFRDYEKEIEMMKDITHRFNLFRNEVEHGTGPLEHKITSSFDRNLAVLTRNVILRDDPVAELMGPAWSEIMSKFTEPSFLGYPEPPLKLKRLGIDGSSEVFELIIEVHRTVRSEYSRLQSRITD